MATSLLSYLLSFFHYTVMHNGQRWQLFCNIVVCFVFFDGPNNFQYIVPLGTIWIPWTTRYPQKPWTNPVGITLISRTTWYSLNPFLNWVIFENLGPLCTLLIPLSNMYPLDTMDTQIPFYFGPLGDLWIPWTTRFPSDSWYMHELILHIYFSRMLGKELIMDRLLLLVQTCSFDIDLYIGYRLLVMVQTCRYLVQTFTDGIDLYLW